MIKRLFSLLTLPVVCVLSFSSCMKEEKPYAINQPAQTGDYKVNNGSVSIGEDYETQVYFSFTTGQSTSNSYREWDISFSNNADTPELWMNGGKEVLIYPTGKKDFASVISIGATATSDWKYDDPSGLVGTSGLGILSDQNHIGEVLIVDGGEKVYFKLQITGITATQYQVKVGPLEAATGSDITLDKDNNYNFVYYSFNTGIVKPEPPKKDWDILFTRYRHVYRHFNPDGSDKTYLVNGVLSNPYKTQCGDDSLHQHEFYAFSQDDAKAFTMYPNRDVIGFDWKTPDIKTAQYTVNPLAIFLIKDQQDVLWKMHFISFYGSDGKKGTPQFEYQRLQ